MTNTDRIQVYKQAAQLLVNKSFAYNEMELLANVISYLAKEIQAHEATTQPEETNDECAEASADTGSQG